MLKRKEKNVEIVMHQAKAAHLIASHLRQHSQNKRVKIFHLLIAFDFTQQISSKKLDKCRIWKHVFRYLKLNSKRERTYLG